MKNSNLKCAFRLWATCMLGALLLFVADARAQTLTLIPGSFYPDTSICHLNQPVKFIGTIKWTTALTKHYTVVFDYGDGQGDSVNKVTGSWTNGSDTTKAVHSYITAGPKTVKVFLKDSLGVVLDSIVRQYDVGSCQAVSGVIFYDCNPDCQKDSMELGWNSRNRLFGLVVNNQYRDVWIDADACYNIPLFTGDTIKAPPGVIDAGYTSFSSCAFTPITTGSLNRNLPLATYYPLGISNLQMNSNVCKGGGTTAEFNVNPGSGGGWRVLEDMGNGTPPGGFLYISSAPYTVSAYYPNAGTYQFKLYLYSDNWFVSGYYGPLMVLTRQITVDTCKTVHLNLFYDQNTNCQRDAGEKNAGDYYVNLSSQKQGNQTLYLDSAGHGTFRLFTGDTATINPNITQYSPYFYQSNPVYEAACQVPLMITSNDTVYKLPYRSAVEIHSAYPLPGNKCVGDTIIFRIDAGSQGCQPSVPYKLKAIYGDGTMDSMMVYFPTDSITILKNHVYQSHGTMNPLFILSAGNSIADSITCQLTVGNCTTISMRAFYDYNRNCVKDAGEAYAMNYQVNCSGFNGMSDAATGIIGIPVYAGGDSLNYLHDWNTDAEYYRSFNKKYCNWPVFTGTTPYLEMPLDDTAVFTAQWSNSTTQLTCDSILNNTLTINVSGNHRPYPFYAVFYYGDTKTDTLSLDSIRSASKAYSLSHLYYPRNYLRAIEVYDSVSGVKCYSKSWPLAVYDTCNRLKGKVFIDSNNNCKYDFGEPLLQGVVVHSIQTGPSQLHVEKVAMTDNGRFAFSEYAGYYVVLKLPKTLANGLNLSCVSDSIRFKYLMDTTLYFPYQCSAGRDLSLTAGHRYWKNGVTDTISLYIGGNYCDATSGALSLDLDNGMTYLWSSLNTAQVTGNKVTWPVDSLSKIPAVVKVAISTSNIPAGTRLCVRGSILPTVPDSNMLNNYFTLCDNVRSSQPLPMYKSVTADSMSGNGAVGLGKQLVYTIRFTNNTADTVSQVVIYDTLSAVLDATSVSVLASSYPYSIHLVNGNVLQVTVQNIKLAPAAEGEFVFAINPLPGIAPGTVVYNKAVIMLGYLVQYSNTAACTLGIVPSAIEHLNGGAKMDVKIYPVPVHNSFYVAPEMGDKDEKLNLVITDIRGVEMYRRVVANLRSTEVPAEGWMPGIYLVQLSNENGRVVRKIVVQ